MTSSEVKPGAAAGCLFPAGPGDHPALGRLPPLHARTRLRPAGSRLLLQGPLAPPQLPAGAVQGRRATCGAKGFVGGPSAVMWLDRGPCLGTAGQKLLHGVTPGLCVFVRGEMHKCNVPQCVCEAAARDWAVKGTADMRALLGCSYVCMGLQAEDGVASQIGGERHRREQHNGRHRWPADIAVLGSRW